MTLPPFTLEDFSQLPRGREKHEISAGALITMPPQKSLHALLGRKIFRLLEAILDVSGFGFALIEAGYILSRDPLTFGSLMSQS
ncbi:MAG: Uma2 family endonuclease [Bryobacteraceae bacterium]